MKRLLFVETNGAVRDSLTTALTPEKREWELSFCSSGTEALDACKNESYDVLISRNKLPDQSGTELFEILKKVCPQTIRFLLIEENEAGHFKGLMNAAQQTLVEPLNTEIFIQRIERAFSLRTVISNPDILKLIGNADALPPLPRIFQRVTQKLNDPNSSLNDVADILTEDVALSSKVLKLANSALFNLRSPARDISHAVSLLGSRTISSLVLSQSMAESFDYNPEYQHFVEELNRHSIACGTNAAKILTKWKAKRPVVEQAVFCGIVHEIGKLILARYAPDQWPSIMERIREGIRPDVQIERQALGLSHCEIAAYLLAIWGFPDEQVSVVAFHHEPSRFRYNESELLRAMHLAENLTPTSLHGEEFDLDYLEQFRIDERTLKKLRALVSKK